MYNIQPAYVFNASYDLLEEPACFLLFNPLYLHDVVKQLTATGIFHNEVQFFLCLYDLIELHNLRMPNDLKDVDLSRYPLHICHIDNLAFLKDLNSNFFLSESVSPQFDFAECSLTNRLPQDVVADGFVIL